MVVVYSDGNRTCPLGFQCPISVCPALEKVQPRPQQGQNKTQGPEFLLHIKAPSFGVHRWLLSSLSPHPGSLVCSRRSCVAASNTAAKATWLWRESARVHGVSVGRKQETGREKELLVPLGFGFGTDRGLFQKNQSISQAFMGF